MKRTFLTFAAAALVGIGSMAFASAPDYLETFEDYDGTFDGSTGAIGFTAGTTTIVPFQSGTVSGGSFAGSPLAISTDSPFAGDQALTWHGDSDRFALVRGGADFASSDPLDGTEGQVYAAFALRVDSLDPTLANNDIEILRLGQGGGFRDIHVGVLDGVLELVGTNGAALVELSTEAFDPGSSENWADDEWRVLAISATLDTTDPESVVKVWLVADDGSATLLGETAPFTAARDSGINHYGIGAFVAIPTGTAAIQITTDEWGIYDAANVTDETDFLAKVAEHYWGVVPSNVDGWHLFD